MIDGDAFGEGVAVNAQDFGRIGQMLFMSGKRSFYIDSLKLSDGFVE